jgi:hypothetical protein
LFVLLGFLDKEAKECRGVYIIQPDAGGYAHFFLSLINSTCLFC